MSTTITQTTIYNELTDAVENLKKCEMNLEILKNKYIEVGKEIGIAETKLTEANATYEEKKTAFDQYKIDQGIN